MNENMNLKCTVEGNPWLKMTPEEKYDMAGRLIKAVTSVRPYTMAFSGGKDSCLLERITIDYNVKVPKVHNVTTIDPEGTLSLCLKHGCTLNRNKLSFLDLVEKKGMPTMFRRFCCKELKEKYISDYLFTGVRRSESVKRAQRYTCFEDTYVYSKKVSTVRFHPLLWFTDEDVDYLVNSHQIECHSLYYNHEGKFCVDRRLGCIGCPLQGDRGKIDYLKYPKLLKQVILRLIKFHERQGRSAYDAYLNAAYNLFYSNHGYEKYTQAFEGLFETDPKVMLEEYFFIDLP